MCVCVRLLYADGDADAIVQQQTRNIQINTEYTYMLYVHNDGSNWVFNLVFFLRFFLEPKKPSQPRSNNSEPTKKQNKNEHTKTGWVTHTDPRMAKSNNPENESKNPNEYVTKP